MVTTPIYMDNHATTRTDPRVVEAMLPFFTETFGNAGSSGHAFGWEARDAIDIARQSIATAINASPRELVFTSGATESNNLAIRGVAERPRRKGNHFISVATEHPAVLDPLKKLARRNFDVTILPVTQDGSAEAGIVAAERVAEAIRDDTILVSVMLANNEIGAIPALAEIGAVCREREVLLHCDATQAVGRIPVDVEALNVDLMSFTSHKIYGPKGVGALYVRRRRPYVSLESQIDGGGQEGTLRSGTLNVSGIVGFAKSLELCIEELPGESERLAKLRNALMAGLQKQLDGVYVCGPALDAAGRRLPGNLNVRFDGVDGEALMMSMNELAVSTGSACTSAKPEPSHVLRALGLSDDQVRSSLRFGLGRFNTDEEVEFAVDAVVEGVQRLRRLSSLPSSLSVVTPPDVQGIGE